MESSNKVEQSTTVSEDNSDTVSVMSGQSLDQTSELILIKQLDTIVDIFENFNSKNLKDSSLTKEFVVKLSNNIKKINKHVSQLNNNSYDMLVKEASVSLKSKDSKKPKKQMDKDKCAVNIKKDTYPAVLKFMKFDEESQVSRSDILQKISSYVKQEKLSVENNTKFFHLQKDLKDLFDFIRVQKIERGDITESDEFPTQISYQQIMGYLKYCFHPTVKK
jgi:hypothetical protein